MTKRRTQHKTEETFFALDLNNESCEFDSFIQYMREIVTNHDRDHVFTDNYKSMLPTLTRDLKFFEAGKANSVPEEWLDLHTQFTKIQANKNLKEYFCLQDSLKDEIKTVSESTNTWINKYANPGDTKLKKKKK